MGRKRAEINVIRGVRLKALLKSKGVEQQTLADMIGYSVEHISYIINGKRNLTEDAAKRIVELFPGTRISWLLGYDDYETESDRISSIIGRNHNRHDLICNLISMHGYTVSKSDLHPSGGSCHLQYPPGISDEDVLRRIHSTRPEPIISIKAPSGSCRFVEGCEYRRILKNIDDYIEMQLSFLFRKLTDGAKEYWG